MKKLLTTLIIALTLCTVRPLYAQQGVIESDPFDIVIPNAITSSVSVIIVEDNGEMGTCSGVVIKNTPTESIVLTAKHCLAFQGEMYVNTMLVDSIGISYKSDLAYLVINKFIPYKTPVRVSNYIPKEKDKIVGIGYPTRRLYKTIGTIYAETPTKQYAFIDIIKGCSGGGAFNVNGELIGIMISHYPGIGMGILVRLQDIHRMINVNRLLEK